MLTYKIRKPGVVSTMIGRVFGNPKPPHIAGPVNKMFQRMSKLEYDRWLEKNVRGKYTRGDMATLATIPVIPNQTPSVVYEITYINELWYNAKWDDVVGEPEALTVVCSNRVVLDKCPSVLRKLTEEECKLVNLSNQTAQGHS